MTRDVSGPPLSAYLHTRSEARILCSRMTESVQAYQRLLSIRREASSLESQFYPDTVGFVDVALGPVPAEENPFSKRERMMQALNHLRSQVTQYTYQFGVGVTLSDLQRVKSQIYETSDEICRSPQPEPIREFCARQHAQMRRAVDDLLIRLQGIGEPDLQLWRP